MTGGQFVSNCTADAMAHAAQSLKSGALVAFPTETVYGLGADATNAEAVARIYQVKGRPADHPLIVHVGDMQDIADWSDDIPDYAIALARAFWPGPMTLILMRSSLAHDFITGGQDTVGLRVPNHVIALALLNEFKKIGGKGIAAPSANRFGHVSPTTAQAVSDELSQYLAPEDLLLDGGPSLVGVESTIIDCTTESPKILRPGAITEEMIEDDQYMIVGSKKAAALAYSMRQTKEIVGANVYNRAFNASYTGGDGKEMCATDHPNVTGGTWANELTTSADISEASLEQAIIDMGKWTNDRGLKIAVRPKRLIIPKELMFEVTRILTPDRRTGTDLNDPNALKTMGYIPEVVVNHYLTDTDAWFLLTSVQDSGEGMKYFERDSDEFNMDEDFDTENAKYKARARYSFGWTDRRCIYGSPGV
mgnify:CR=1 FL=1